MLLLQHYKAIAKTLLSGTGGTLQLGIAAITLMAVFAGVSQAQTSNAAPTPGSVTSTDVFEDVFAPVPWQANPRSSRIVQTSYWRGTSQASKPRDVSRKPEAAENEVKRESRKASAVRNTDSTRRVKPVAYDNIISANDDGGYVLDPVADEQIQAPVGQPMEVYEDGMSYEPMQRSYGGMAYGDVYGDPAMTHPWQGGEYWFNPRDGIPPFLCRFPHWLGFARGRLYFRGEYLVWWTAGNDTPPLVTTSPLGTAKDDAGVLGEQGTSILYGGDKRNTGQQSGGRYSLGYWLSDAQCFGFELNYLHIGKVEDTFSTDSDETAIIARPFTNAVGGDQDAALVSFSGTQEGDLSGSIDIESITEFRSFEFLFRRAVVQNCNHRIDVVFGYRYGRLDDRLTITDNVLELSGEELEFDGYDRFDTRNRFNGAEFGVVLNKRSGRWGLELLAKLAVGRTKSTVEIAGSTMIDNADTYDGSILALPTNMGTYKTKEVAVMPEIGANLMYNISPRIAFTFGYTFVYMSHVARPGDQIDTFINTSQFPPNTLNGVGLPEFHFQTTDFWAHGMNFGFDFRF
ncbi:MAG: BBP7 family outer membrane beta-barrel protein [Pirellulales bacterium]|nr:BBP7 family outer membrane beta-barrel protein [Pirellulales bacterium]